MTDTGDFQLLRQQTGATEDWYNLLQIALWDPAAEQSQDREPVKGTLVPFTPAATLSNR